MTPLLVQLQGKAYPCEIVHSSRARYLRLKLSNNGLLSVVVPRGISFETVEGFVNSQAGWIDRKLAELIPISADHDQPKRLDLTYLGEEWGLDYLPVPTSSTIEVKVVDTRKLECCGMVDNIPLLHKVLGMWLKAQAERVIPDRLATLAEEHGFHFNRVTIRGQKTRWGSCSSKKNINLNYKLLFLEPALVDYVLLHELCHTIEMNHSKRFWNLVGDCDKNYKIHDKQLNKLAKTLPL